MHDTRSPERLRHHYEIERTLAARLRAAPREQRCNMLTGLYAELFERVPDHPRLTRKLSPEMSREGVAGQMRFLRRFLRPETTFLEIGPGDCALSFEVSRNVKSVFGVDVDLTLTQNPQAPGNFRFFLSDGVSVPVPAGSVDVAYSNQLMEHLHPDDAREQLRNIYQALAPGGAYICLTPNRLNGPHDISHYFREEADCFHLKEYTVTELEALFRDTGFHRIQAFARIKRLWSKVPLEVIRSLERWLQELPAAQRRSYADRWPLRPLLNGALVAYR
jgi:SAM-dependent methyltransferase